MPSYAAYGGNPNSSRNANAENSWGSWKWPGGVPGNMLGTARYGNVSLTVRNELVELVTLLMQATETKFGYNLYGPNEKPPAGWCWGYENRAISGTNTASNHSKGRAVDLNAPNNPYTSPLVCDMPPGMVNMWENAGFYWGGRYSGSKDAMHFEYCYTPGDVSRHVAYVRSILGGSALPAPQPGTPSAPSPAPATGDFPLPSGYYYGPKDGPTESISGMSGESGAWVEGLRRAQRQLIARGFNLPAYGADGQYGAHADGETHDATVAFQQSAGLEADGLIGPSTWQKLFASSPSGTDPDGWLTVGAKEEILDALKNRTPGSQSLFDEQRYTAENVLVPAIKQAIEHSQETRRMLGVMLNWNPPQGPESTGLRAIQSSLSLVVADDSDSGAVFAFGAGVFYHVPDPEHYTVGVSGQAYSPDVYHTNRRGLDVLQSICLGLPNLTDKAASEIAKPAQVKTYTVKKGDTFGAIAKQLGITVDALKAANPAVTNIDSITEGQVLTVPKA